MRFDVSFRFGTAAFFVLIMLIEWRHIGCARAAYVESYPWQQLNRPAVREPNKLPKGDDSSTEEMMRAAPQRHPKATPPNLAPKESESRSALPLAKVYQHVDWVVRGGANVRNSGAEWLPMLRMCSILKWVNSVPPEVSARKINDSIDGMKLDAPYKGLVILDLEPWAVEKDPHKMRDLFLDALEATRKRLPSARIGFYGIPTVPAFTEEHVDAFTEVWNCVDVICPQIYSTTSSWDTTQHQVTTKRIQLARQVARGKPVLPFVMGTTVGDEPWFPIPLESLTKRVELAHTLGVNGFIYFDREVNGVLNDEQQAARIRMMLDVANRGSDPQ